MAVPTTAWAEPAAGPEGPTAPAADPVGAAQSEGDLSGAAEAATAAREADPTPENWHREGEALEAMGDLDGAATAYEGEIAALPKDDEAGLKRARADLQRVRDDSRGRVEEEPASSHRGEFDKQWAPPAPKKKKKQVKPPSPVDKPPEDRIVRKWYFWVTVAAIVASAAAVTGIAIKASRDERRDALDQRRRKNIVVPPLFRF